MFWHILFLATFSKNGSVHDNSTTFTSPEFNNLSFDNVENVPNTMKLFPNSSVTMKRSANKDKEPGTDQKNVSRAFEVLTSTMPTKQPETDLGILAKNLLFALAARPNVDARSAVANRTSPQEATVKTLTNVDAKNNTEKLTSDKGIETIQGNASRSLSESHLGPKNTDETTGAVRRVREYLIFDMGMAKDAQRLIVDKENLTTNNSSHTNTSESTKIEGSTKTQETTNDKMVKNPLLGTTASKTLETLVGDKESEIKKDKLRHNASEPTKVEGSTQTRASASGANKMAKNSLMDITPATRNTENLFSNKENATSLHPSPHL